MRITEKISSVRRPIRATAGKLRHIPVVVAFMAMLAAVLPASAQSDIQFTQYWAVPAYYNPAATGSTDFLRIRGGARLQWVGIENAPKSFLIQADSPLRLFKKKIGVGLTMMQESLGLFSNMLLNAQGSYKLKLFKGELSVGVQVGYYNTKFKGSEVYIPDGDDYHQPTDPGIPTQDLTGSAVDFSLGAFYTHKYFYAGIAGQHLTSPKVTMSIEGSESTESQQYETELARMLYFTGGGNIALRNTLFEMQPSLIVKTDFNTFSAEVTMRATYNKFITFGLGYRWKDAVSVMVGAEYKNFFLGYAYDYPTSAISKASSGSHEIVAGYRLKLDFSGKNRNKHRSIRIM